jgi:hypothetical protein
MFRFYEVNGKRVDEPLAATASICEMYEYPESKPYEVLFDGADCEYYEKDE